MDQAKIDELRQRMLHHKVVNDQAVVEVTAAELEELLYLAEKGINAMWVEYPPMGSL